MSKYVPGRHRLLFFFVPAFSFRQKTPSLVFVIRRDVFFTLIVWSSTDTLSLLFAVSVRIAAIILRSRSSIWHFKQVLLQNLDVEMTFWSISTSKVTDTTVWPFLRRHLKFGPIILQGKLHTSRLESRCWSLARNCFSLSSWSHRVASLSLKRTFLLIVIVSSLSVQRKERK